MFLYLFSSAYCSGFFCAHFNFFSSWMAKCTLPRHRITIINYCCKTGEQNKGNFGLHITSVLAWPSTTFIRSILYLKSKYRPQISHLNLKCVDYLSDSLLLSFFTETRTVLCVFLYIR